MRFANRMMAFGTEFVAASWLTGFLLLTGLALSTNAHADTIAARNCKIDTITQSVCIYGVILEDVDKNYPLRGGGGIGRIVQNSTTSYSAYILQEGREDVRIYEVKVLGDGKVTISHVTENTVTH